MDVGHIQAHRKLALEVIGVQHDNVLDIDILQRFDTCNLLIDVKITAGILRLLLLIFRCYQVILFNVSRQIFNGAGELSAQLKWIPVLLGRLENTFHPRWMDFPTFFRIPGHRCQILQSKFFPRSSEIIRPL